MWRRHWLVFSQAVTIALGVLFVVGTLKPEWLPATTPAAVPLITPPTAPAVGLAPVALPLATPARAPRAASAATMPSFAAAARRALPAVVSIQAVAGNAARGSARLRTLPGADGPPQAGSGVIVSSDGYLLTNHHVVDGATDFAVRLADGRTRAARLVGTDPETDLAVLRIDEQGLPAAAFGNLPALQVGDPVLAIGNPFNVGQTVTSGIVSALGRNRLGLSTYENFIQTDAAINPGNSGGALVDGDGNLVGINTAIFSRSGGSLGIGFAIPVDTARLVLDAIVRDGQVRRGWIGVETRDLTPELAEGFGLPVQDGVLVTGVVAGSPAAAAGMRPGDVVRRVGERAVLNGTELLSAVAALKPDTQARLGVQRGREAMELSVQVALRSQAMAARGR